MLATLTDRRDFGEGWLLERKLDGERCVASKDGSDVRLESRTGKDLTGTYPEVRAALASQAGRRMLLDGEVVAYDGEQTSFSRLQQRLGVARPSPQLVGSYPVVYCVFDLLELDGEDLTARSLLQRRARLTKALRPGDALQLIEASRGDSERRFAEACRSGWEGLIAKRADAPYTRGRSRDWLKLKCAWEQELVIGGFTDPAGSRTDFGALLVGYHETASSATPARSAPAIARRRSATSVAGCARSRRTSHRFSTLGRSRPAHIGPARSSWPRSPSRSGPPAVACDRRVSSACATTRTRTR